MSLDIPILGLSPPCDVLKNWKLIESQKKLNQGEKLLLFGDLHFTDFCWQPGKIGWWQQQYFHSQLCSIFCCCLGGLIWVTTTFYIQWKLKHSKYFLNFYSQFSTPTLEPSGSWFWRWLYIVTFDLRCVEPLVEYQRQPDTT